MLSVETAITYLNLLMCIINNYTSNRMFLKCLFQIRAAQLYGCKLPDITVAANMFVLFGFLKMEYFTFFNIYKIIVFIRYRQITITVLFRQIDSHFLFVSDNGEQSLNMARVLVIDHRTKSVVYQHNDTICHSDKYFVF